MKGRKGAGNWFKRGMAVALAVCLGAVVQTNSSITSVHAEGAGMIEGANDYVRRSTLADWNSKYIHLNKTKATIQKKEKIKLTLINADSKKVKWKSGKKKVASVKKGTVTAKKNGKTVITATYKKVKYKCTITVKKKSATITISDSSILLSKGKSKSVKLNNANAKKVKWSTSNASVATVSKGMITAKEAGSATITATYNRKNFTCAVRVYSLTKLGNAKVTAEDNEKKIGGVSTWISPITLEGGEQTLTVSKAENLPSLEGIELKTYDFKLSGGGELKAMARLGIPLEIGEGEVALAATFDEDTGEWELIPCDAVNGMVYALTDHFSAKGVAAVKESDVKKLIKDQFTTKAKMTPEFFEVVGLNGIKKVVPEQAANKLIEVAQAGSITDDMEQEYVEQMRKYVYDYTLGMGWDLWHALGFEEITSNDGELGELFKYANLAVYTIRALRYEADGQPNKAAMTALQGLGGFYVAVMTGMLGGKIAAAAGFAVGFIMYSLDQLYDQQLDSFKETHYQALKHYYEEDNASDIANGRMKEYWKKKFYNYFSGELSQEEVNNNINSDLNDFASKFWDLPSSEQAFYFAEAGVTGQMTGWGNNPEACQAATEKYVEVDLKGNLLKDVYEEIEKDKRQEVENNAKASMTSLANWFNKTITLNFYDESYDATRGWSDYAQWTVKFKNIPNNIKDKQNLQCELNKEGKGKIEFTLASDILYGFKNVFEVYDENGMYVTDLSYDLAMPTSNLDIDNEQTRAWVREHGMYLSLTDIVLPENKCAVIFLKNAPNAVSWESSDTSVATVDGSGKVKAKNMGTCIIRSSCKGKDFYCDVRVEEAEDKDGDGISEGKPISMQVGEKKDAPGKNAPLINIDDGIKTLKILSTNYKSSNTSVLEVSGGVMAAKKKGKANMTVTQKVSFDSWHYEYYLGSDGKYHEKKVIDKIKTTWKNEYKVTVSKRSFSLSTTSVSMKVGDTVKIKLKNTVASSEVKWSTSNPNVASIKDSGEHNEFCTITAENKGKAVIKAKVDGQSYSCKVTVIEAEDSVGIYLSPTEATIKVGGTKKFKLVGAVAKNVSWSTSNTSVATVDKNGKVTGVSKGIAYVYAKYKGSTYTGEVWVGSYD